MVVLGGETLLDCSNLDRRSLLEVLEIFLTTGLSPRGESGIAELDFVGGGLGLKKGSVCNVL